MNTFNFLVVGGFGILKGALKQIPLSTFYYAMGENV